MAKSSTTKDDAPKPMTAKEKREARAAAAAAAKDAGKPTPDDTKALNEAAITRPDRVADAHGKIADVQKSGETVVVGCKVGVAFIDIQLCREVEVYENTQTGPRTIKRYDRIGKVVRLRGTSYPRGTPPEGYPEKPMIVAGAALNFGVDKDFWDAWVEQNKLNPLVLNKMVFAHANLDFVKGIAQEHSAEKSGLDPVNPKGDTRMPKSTRSDVGNIETEETRAKKMERAAQGG